MSAVTSFGMQHLNHIQACITTYVTIFYTQGAFQEKKYLSLVEVIGPRRLLLYCASGDRWMGLYTAAMEGDPAGEGAGVAGTALEGSAWPSPALTAGLALAGSARGLLRSVPALASVVLVRLGRVVNGCVLNATLPRPVRTAGSVERAVCTLAPGRASSACKLHVSGIIPMRQVAILCMLRSIFATCRVGCIAAQGLVTCMTTYSVQICGLQDVIQ